MNASQLDAIYFYSILCQLGNEVWNAFLSITLFCLEKFLQEKFEIFITDLFFILLTNL